MHIDVSSSPRQARNVHQSKSEKKKPNRIPHRTEINTHLSCAGLEVLQVGEMHDGFLPLSLPQRLGSEGIVPDIELLDRRAALDLDRKVRQLVLKGG